MTENKKIPGKIAGLKKRGREIRPMQIANSNNTRPMKTIEPATTLMDDGRFLRIVSELPGIAEEKIKIDLEPASTSITIAAADSVKQYIKVITIPCEVRIHKKRFFDGVLELTLEKTNPDTH